MALRTAIWKILGVGGLLGLALIQGTIVPPLFRSFLAILTGAALWFAGALWAMTQHMHFMVTIRAPQRPEHAETVPGTDENTRRALEALRRGAEVSLNHETGEWTIGPIPGDQ